MKLRLLEIFKQLNEHFTVNDKEFKQMLKNPKTSLNSSDDDLVKYSGNKSVIDIYKRISENKKQKETQLTPVLKL